MDNEQTDELWFVEDELGPQAREAGKRRAIRCRKCGQRWELLDQNPPAACIQCSGSRSCPECEGPLVLAVDELDGHERDCTLTEFSVGVVASLELSCEACGLLVLEGAAAGTLKMPIEWTITMKEAE